ncbi:hypothetical protein ABT120_48775 [Nonomuraea angiospora]|uniref:hypothetical protein n=1 Tax=Nonomuraea angiospora TaxID=46172 RepID=UPI0033226D83
MGNIQPRYSVRGVEAPVGGSMGYLTCFLRDGDRVFLTYSTTGRGKTAPWPLERPAPPPNLSSPDRRGKVLQLLAAEPWRAWKGVELAAILGIENINSFRVQLSQWSHQGYINKIGPALYGPMPTSS